MRLKRRIRNLENRVSKKIKFFINICNLIANNTITHRYFLFCYFNIKNETKIHL